MLHYHRFTVKYTVESLEDPVAITKSCGPVNFSLALAGIIYQGFLLGVSSALGWECRRLPGNYRVSLERKSSPPSFYAEL